MGVPKFVGSISRSSKYRRAFVNTIPRKVSSFSLDANGMIHTAMSIVYGYGDYENPRVSAQVKKKSLEKQYELVFLAFVELLEFAIKETKPHHTLVVAVDGPAVLGKLQQQRGRRYRSAVLTKADSHDTSIVTPGTKFMREFDAFFKNWIPKNRHKLPPKVIYSSHLVPGEGEHKIMELFRQGDEFVEDGAHLLYGLDADLVFLSLMSPLNNIVLVRENLTKVILIDVLRELLIREAPAELKNTAVQDYVALMFMLGNDFLPHGPTHDSMYEIIETWTQAYYEVLEPLTSQVDEFFVINFEVLPKIIEKFYRTEINLLSLEAQHAENDTQRFPNRFAEIATNNDQRVFDYGNFRRAWYFNAIGEKTNNETLLERFAGASRLPGVEDIEAMCLKFIEGMAWCFRYYQTTDVNSRWFYPYHHAPLMIDLMRVLNNPLVVETGETYHEAMAGEDYTNSVLGYGALEQLLAVIPSSSRKVSIPRVLHPLLLRTNSPIIDTFPVGIVVEFDGIEKKDTHFGVPIFPFIDIERTIAAVDLLDLGEDVLKNWKDKKTIFYQPNARQHAVYQQTILRVSPSTSSSPLQRGGSSRGAPRGSRGQRGGSSQGPRGPRGESSRGRGGPRGQRGSRGQRGGRGSSRDKPRGSRGVQKGSRESQRSPQSEAGPSGSSGPSRGVPRGRGRVSKFRGLKRRT